MEGKGELGLFELENGGKEMGKVGERKKASQFHWFFFFFWCSCVFYVYSKVTLKHSLSFFPAFCVFFFFKNFSFVENVVEEEKKR